MRKKSLIISIVVFLIVGLIALFLILNKGYIGSFSLVSTNDSGKNSNDVILPKLSLVIEKDYLSSSNKEDTSAMTVTVDGQTITEGIEFESSDEDIIKINEENLLVPVSDGKVTIKAKFNGVEATDEIEVITPIKTMSFTSTNSTIRVGKDLQLKLKVTPSDAYMDTLTYTSSDESIATVNSNGIVTGIAPGKVTITLYDSYTETEKTVNLTIKK